MSDGLIVVVVAQAVPITIMLTLWIITPAMNKIRKRLDELERKK